MLGLLERQPVGVVHGRVDQLRLSDVRSPGAAGLGLEPGGDAVGLEHVDDNEQLDVHHPPSDDPASTHHHAGATTATANANSRAGNAIAAKRQQ